MTSEATPLPDNDTPTRNFILNLKTEFVHNCFFLLILHNLPCRLLYRISVNYILTARQQVTCVRRFMRRNGSRYMHEDLKTCFEYVLICVF